MNIELILALTALFVATHGFLIAVFMSFRVYRLKHEVKRMKHEVKRMKHEVERIESGARYTASILDECIRDVPAFLKRQAD